MSICTKTGDAGTTALMYNRRVSKTHPRIEACGSIDELNAAIGIARAATTEELISGKLLQVQKDLINLMGELATTSEDLPRYRKDGFSVITEQSATQLENWIHEIEAQKVSFKGWATPGANLPAASLDMARTIGRRAERRVIGLVEAGEIKNQSIQIYLNRVSDLLWLLARWAETKR
jgi:cob(I)alamin adenosyltransferase